VENKKNSEAHNPGEKYENKKISVSGIDPRHRSGTGQKHRCGPGRCPPDLPRPRVQESFVYLILVIIIQFKQALAIHNAVYTNIKGALDI
jgi:hypothetical protein